MSSVTQSEPEKLTKKVLKADHPTWCPGCGDFTVLACFFKVLEELQIPHENICTIAGIATFIKVPLFCKLTWSSFYSWSSLATCNWAVFQDQIYMFLLLAEMGMVFLLVATIWNIVQGKS